MVDHAHRAWDRLFNRQCWMLVNVRGGLAFARRGRRSTNFNGARHVSSLSHHTQLDLQLRLSQLQYLSFPEAHPAALDNAPVREAGSEGSTRDVRGDSNDKVVEFNVYKSDELGCRDDIITGENKKVVLCVSAT
jgi:hypothetical protein